MNRIKAIKLFPCFRACVVALLSVLLVDVLLAPTEKTEAQTPAPFLISPYYGTITWFQGYSTTHRAYDFLLRYAPVLAAESGTIKEVRWYANDPWCHQTDTDTNCGFGLHIRIQHPSNSYWTIYGHLSATAFDLTTVGGASECVNGFWTPVVKV